MSDLVYKTYNCSICGLEIHEDPSSPFIPSHVVAIYGQDGSVLRVQIHEGTGRDAGAYGLTGILADTELITVDEISKAGQNFAII